MRKSFWVSITLGLAAPFLLPISGPAAPLSGQIGDTRQDIQDSRQREGVLTSDIARFSNRIDGLAGQIGGLEQRESRLQAAIAQKRAELIEIRRKLQVARVRVAKLRVDLRIASQALAARLVAIYKADEPDALTVVLEADGFADFLERAEFLERVSDQDQRIVSRVRALKEQVTKQVEDLRSLEQRAQAAAAAMQARRNELASAKARLERAHGDLVGARAARSASLARIKRSRVRLEGNLSSLQSQVQGAMGAGPVKRGSGQFIFPVSGSIGSGFGMRWGRMHEGIDISAPAGTGIRAADSGRVIMAGPTGGYGNYVCIQHTGSLSTCYAHLSSIGVSRGESVGQGDVIGSVGCTGHCFGDHLHFEVRVNGSAVDPMGYL